jgi:hypothetical protein
LNKKSQLFNIHSIGLFTILVLLVFNFYIYSYIYNQYNRSYVISGYQNIKVNLSDSNSFGAGSMIKDIIVNREKPSFFNFIDLIFAQNEKFGYFFIFFNFICCIIITLWIIYILRGI